MDVKFVSNHTNIRHNQKTSRERVRRRRNDFKRPQKLRSRKPTRRASKVKWRVKKWKPKIPSKFKWNRAKSKRKRRKFPKFWANNFLTKCTHFILCFEIKKLRWHDEWLHRKLLSKVRKFTINDYHKQTIFDICLYSLLVSSISSISMHLRWRISCRLTGNSFHNLRSSSWFEATTPRHSRNRDFGCNWIVNISFANIFYKKNVLEMKNWTLELFTLDFEFRQRRLGNSSSAPPRIKTRQIVVSGSPLVAVITFAQWWKCSCVPETWLVEWKCHWLPSVGHRVEDPTIIHWMIVVRESTVQDEQCVRDGSQRVPRPTFHSIVRIVLQNLSPLPGVQVQYVHVVHSGPAIASTENVHPISGFGASTGSTCSGRCASADRPLPRIGGWLIANQLIIPSTNVVLQSYGYYQKKVTRGEAATHPLGRVIINKLKSNLLVVPNPDGGTITTEQVELAPMLPGDILVTRQWFDSSWTQLAPLEIEQVESMKCVEIAFLGIATKQIKIVVKDDSSGTRTFKGNILFTSFCSAYLFNPVWRSQSNIST